MKKRTIALMIGLAFAVVLLWISALWVSPLILSIVGPAQVADVGATGDMFGTITSLFTGLGAYAVVVVLIVDLRERRKDLRHRQEEFRPFVTLELKDAEIEDARWKGEHFHLTLSLRFNLANLAQAPALNLSVDSSVQAGDVKVPATISASNSPLLASSTTPATPRIADVQYTASGDKALGLFRQLENGTDPIDAHLLIKYTSMNGISWLSRVTYRAKLANLDHRAVIARVAAPKSSETIGKSADALGTDNIVMLSASAVTGTWEQARDD